ncbi:hypothetical protein AS026_13290 [Rhizobium altiplani]|uniref:Abi-like protein n=1 Tax=Rhizobium altiplani TaxID=1864509 RepID=A0A109JEY7_9HYPH|nr:hypothetical protein AS026_13290 [Rhizobium altiplani]
MTQVRISRYLAAAKNDKQLALRLYVWNARLCECLYLPVQFTEVAVRNAVMRPVLRRFKADWFERPAFQNILPPRLAEELSTAVAKERRRHGLSLTGGHVVSALSLGFWVALLGVSYENHLWHNGMADSFPNARNSADRETIYLCVEELRKVRNEIMHHAAIFDRGPKGKLATVMDLLGMVSVETRDYVARLDTLSQVINERPRC